MFSYKKRKKQDPKQRRRRSLMPYRKKVCRFCLEKNRPLDYRDIMRLRKFTTERGKILPSRISGNCAKHQREVAKAIRRARSIALMPFVSE